MKRKGYISNLAALVLFLSFALFIGVSIFSLPQETYAAVTELNAWFNIWNSAPGNNSGTITAGNLMVGSGSNRLFLSAVCLETDAAATITTLNVTLGGTALTTIGSTGTASVQEHCYMGYLKESQIPAGNNILSVQYDLSGTTANVTGIHVKWASYSGVGQGNPINDSSAGTIAGTTITFGNQIDYLANGLTLYVAANGGGAGCIMTVPTDFSQSQATSANSHSSFIAATANHGSSGSYSSGTTVSFGGTTQARSAIVVAAINPLATIVGDGTDTIALTIGPATDGAPATKTLLERFTLKTTTASDTVSGVEVTLLTAGSSGGLSYIDITSEDELTVYGSVSNPASDTVSIALGTNISVTTTETAYKVRISPKYHNDTPAMPAPPGSSYIVNGKVTGITCTNPVINNDANTAFEYVTIDNQSPSNPTWGSISPEDGQIVLNWTKYFLDQVVLLRNTVTPVPGTPVEGRGYSLNETLDGSIVRYVGSANSTTDTEVVNGQTYYYKIFAKDSYGNYSYLGAEAGPYMPGPVVTASSSGTRIAEIEAGSTAQYIGAAFTFQQSSGTAGTITALTITDAGSADADAVLKNVKVYYESDVASCSYGGTENLVATTLFNASHQIVLGSISIPVSLLSPNNYFTCVYVVFDVDLLAVKDSTVWLRITNSADFTLSGVTNKKGSFPLYLPGGWTTLKDTTPPGNVDNLVATPGDAQITFNWTNPSDADFAGVCIMRATGDTAPANCPADCTGGTKRLSPSTSYTDSPVSNGQQYSYRLCSYDETPNPNYSSGVTISATPSSKPLLEYPAAPYDDGKDPDTGDTTTDFTFKVIYTDYQDDPPASGFPKIYIGDNDGINDDMFSYTMTAEDDLDTDYTDGKTYYFTTGFGAAVDLRFYFEAKAASGDTTLVYLPSYAPGLWSIGPSVYLMPGYNMVGVPKELGSGLSYGSVLGDDSGYPYCIFWDSTGPDLSGFQGQWINCTSGNIENGKGYYIWALDPNAYRLDEPSGVGNVIDAYVDIELAAVGGWTVISNPYNANIQVQNVKVVRSATEYTFSQAVTNNWIGNAIYEWEGSVSGYIFKAFNGSPPATLEPWVGYFIYVIDTTPTTLRVYAPAP